MGNNHQLPASSDKSCNKDQHLPVISVIMSNYNTEFDILKESIDSILNQTFTDFEFIIVDDCSFPEMQADTLIAEYNDERIIYLKNEQNLGLAGSLNRAMSIARGKYIARMDTDDISLPNRFIKQVEYMEKHPEIAVLSGRIHYFGKRNGYRIANSTNDFSHLKVLLLFECFVNHPTVFIRKSFLTENNLSYNPALRRAQDYDLWSRIISEEGIVKEYSTILLHYRTTDGQSSSKHRKNQIENAKQTHIHQLFALGIVPDEKEIEIHEILSDGQSYGDYSFSELLQWCKKIIAYNKKANIYKENALKDILSQQLIVCCKNHNTFKTDFFSIFLLFKLNTIYYFFNMIRRKIILFLYSHLKK